MTISHVEKSLVVARPHRLCKQQALNAFGQHHAVGHSHDTRLFPITPAVGQLYEDVLLVERHTNAIDAERAAVAHGGEQHAPALLRIALRDEHFVPTRCGVLQPNGFSTACFLVYRIHYGERLPVLAKFRVNPRAERPITQVRRGEFGLRRGPTAGFRVIPLPAIGMDRRRVFRNNCPPREPCVWQDT